MSLTTDTSKHITFRIKPMFGSDPELFIATKGQIIGAEKVIPKEGLVTADQARYGGSSKIELDGVQVELHPAPRNCRALIANDFKMLMTKLRETTKAKGAEVSFDTVVKMSAEEMKTLSAGARQLGCAPSNNVYDPTATVKVGKNFRERSAGGHIHMSVDGYLKNTGYGHAKLSDADVKTLVTLFDICVGLPSVFIDRDPAQARRRKVYGRAGEHRAKPYGLEYRVLSNFWLRSYPLMSYAFGMMRMAANIWYFDKMGPYDYPQPNKWNASADLIKRVDLEKVRTAINKNDPRLAMKQWVIVEEFLDDHYADTTSGLSSGEPLINFRHFIEEIESKGIEHWFPEDPIEHWCNLLEGHQLNQDGFAGWETFLNSTVAESRADSALDRAIATVRAA